MPDPVSPGRRRPRLWQKAALVALGCLPVLAAEAGLRLAGFGGSPPLLVPLLATDEGLLAEVNPRLAELFFARRSEAGASMVGAHRREILLQPKPPDVVRVVFVGASSVEGFPLPRNLTAAAFLERMLAEALPERRVEVLNLGVTAVASYPVRRIAEAALAELEPDLLLVYAGHNELYGAAGVASWQTLGRSPAVIAGLHALQRTALVQAVRALGAPDSTGGERTQDRRHLIQVMARIPRIEPDGPLHRAAHRTLRASFEGIVDAAAAAGVPVVLSTLVSLERDMAPLASWTELAGHLAEDWRRRRREALALLPRDPAAAADTLASLAAAEPRHAGVRWDLARALAAAGRDAEADEAWAQARDLDAMPWRAARATSGLVRELAGRRGVPLADPQRAFAEAAGGATGWELFYDHVHPSLRGQALLARSFYDVIVGKRLLGEAPPGPPADWRRVAASLGAHPLEDYLASHQMATLFAVPPMGRHNEAAAAHWRGRLAEMEAAAGPVERRAIARWREASAAAGFALPISFFAGATALGSGEPRRAEVYLRAAAANAYELGDERAAAHLLLARALAAGGDVAALAAELPLFLAEARAAARLPGQPTPLLSAALAGLCDMAGQDADAARWRDRALQGAAGAPPWAAAYLVELGVPAFTAGGAPPG